MLLSLFSTLSCTVGALEMFMWQDLGLGTVLHLTLAGSIYTPHSTLPPRSTSALKGVLLLSFCCCCFFVLFLYVFCPVCLNAKDNPRKELLVLCCVQIQYSTLISINFSLSVHFLIWGTMTCARTTKLNGNIRLWGVGGGAAADKETQKGGERVLMSHLLFMPQVTLYLKRTAGG